MWENRVVRLPEDPELQQETLDEVALDGWRLVSVSDGLAYFVRRGAVTLIPKASRAATANHAPR